MTNLNGYMIKMKKRREEKEYAKKVMEEIFQQQMAETLIESMNEVFKRDLLEDEISVFGESSILSKKELDCITSSLHENIQNSNSNLFFYPRRVDAVKALFSLTLPHRRDLLLSLFSKKKQVLLGEHEGCATTMAFAEYNLKNVEDVKLGVIAMIYSYCYTSKEVWHLKNDKKETIEKMHRKAYLYSRKMIHQYKSALGVDNIIKKVQEERKRNRKG